MPTTRKKTAAKLIPIIQAAGQDHEFYPTTGEIIAALVKDLKKWKDDARIYHDFNSVLDIGAGNGKVLKALREAEVGLRELHAIEKSEILCRQLDPDILIVGTLFEEQSLLSKQVDLTFSNPPYSVFEDWTVKIIRQAASRVVYLVIPVRWKDSQPIADALKFRAAKFHTVGEFTFENSEDRAARAKVNLLRIELDRDKDDAFERFFEEQFADLIGKFKTPAREHRERPTKDARFSSLVVGPTYPEALVSLYQQEMANIERNYQLCADLDAELLREFDISPEKIMACLKTRLSGLRNAYWHELFSRLTAITSRLTSGSRQKLLTTLHRHVHVDFTLTNIHAIIIWVIKNANNYIESQLLEIFDLMVTKCNVKLYTSNKRTWEEERWRYNDEGSKNSHYALDFRIVMHRVGGINASSWSRYDRGLSERASHFLGDLLTIANNLGFRCETSFGGGRGDNAWKSNELHEFYFTNREGKLELLYDVRAFQNGNLHLRLNKNFILALNVEHGRLKGWLNSKAEAISELRDLSAGKYFETNLRLPDASPTLLLAA